MVTVALVTAVSLLIAFEIVIYCCRRGLIPRPDLPWAAAFWLSVMIGAVVSMLGRR